MKLFDIRKNVLGQKYDAAKVEEAIKEIEKLPALEVNSKLGNTKTNMSNFLKDGILNKRSQDFEKYYRLNGAIYICKTEKFIENKGFFLKDNIFAYMMDRKNSIDIDEEIDFLFAEIVIELIQ